MASLKLFIANTLILLIKLYKIVLSPYLGRSCKFMPTCSDYAVEAIKQFGPFKGLAMAISRILRCHPFSKGGYDYPR